MRQIIKTATVIFASVLCATSAIAQTIKVGSIITLSGPNATLGENMQRAMNLYMKMHAKDLPPGVNVEIITRDDTGPVPD